MYTSWTREQLQAIHSRGTNLLLSAAAGCGKTSVLVERVVQLILHGEERIDVDRLLLVTFTQAAASEMRERLAQALTRALTGSSNPQRIRRQLLLLEKAHITTLHSYCLDLLRQHFYLLPLSPAFRVMGEAEALTLRQEIMEQVLEKMYARGEKGWEAFERLVDAYGGDRDDRLLKDLVLRVYTFSRTHPWPDRWLDNLLSAYAVEDIDHEFDALPWVRALKETMAQEIRGLMFMVEEALSYARSSLDLACYAETLEQDRNQLARLLQATQLSWEEFRRTGLSLSFPALRRSGRKSALENAEEREKILWMRQEYREKIRGWQNTYFQHSASSALVALKKLSPLVEALVSLIREFGRGYQEAKEAQGLVDFHDLEHYTLNLLLDPSSSPGNLIPSPLAEELKENFVEVLVDEYQDINPLQDIILHLLSRQGKGGGNLVLVGDIKQSIYSFRWAEPAIFANKLSTYSGEPGSPGRKINLTTNFRSRKEILHGINFLFRQIMTKPLGPVEYDASQELRAGADYPQGPGCLAGPIELHLIMERDGGFSDPEGEDDHQVHAEARLLAWRIKDLVSGGKVWDQKTSAFRPLNFGDIAILLRSPQGKTDVYVQELLSHGIPVYTDTGEGYFASPEVATIISLLQIVDNPLQDIPLAATLRSPIVGLKAEDLARIRLAKPDGAFFTAVIEYIRGGRGELAERLKEFWARLQMWRTAARRGSLADLLYQIYRDTGYYDLVAALPSGEQRQANLRALVARAEQYEKGSRRGLKGFLQFIETLRQSGGDLPKAQLVKETENMVRLMSIHKSKGLEFPVVIVAGLGGRFNFRDLYRSVLIHKDLGLAMEVVDREAHAVFSTLKHLALRERLHREALAEELRILYVALTRAKERLILVGSFRGGEEKLCRWCRFASLRGDKLPTSLLAEAKCYLDWIVPAVARHPDGTPLWAAAGLTGCCHLRADEGSSFEVRLWSPEDIPRPEERMPFKADPVLEQLKRLEPIPVAREDTDLKERLNWVYPHIEVACLPSKVTVSDLKKMPEEPFPWPFVRRKPRFMSGIREASSVEIGNAYHLVMQHLDLRGDLSLAGLNKQIAAMVARGLLSADEAELVNPERIERFFQSPLGQRVLRAEAVEREVPFTLGLPASTLYPHLSLKAKEETVVLQGIIDCLAWEGDGWLLIDYKADQIGEGDLRKRVEEYEQQLRLYALAVEKIYGQMVKDKFLYFFFKDLAVRCPT